MKLILLVLMILANTMAMSSKMKAMYKGYPMILPYFATTCPYGYTNIYRSVKGDPIGNFANVYKLEGCVNLCNSYSVCLGFAYSIKNAGCILYAHLPRKTGMP